MHNLNSILNSAVKRVCTESKKRHFNQPLHSSYQIASPLSYYVPQPCAYVMLCASMCGVNKRKIVCMMFDQTPPMVFRCDVLDITTSASFRDVVYCCDSGVGFPKIRLLRQDGGKRTGLIKSFARCRHSVGGSVKDFLSVCSSVPEHRG